MLSDMDFEDYDEDDEEEEAGADGVKPPSKKRKGDE